MDKGGTQATGPKCKEIEDHVQGLTSEGCREKEEEDAQALGIA